MSSKNRFFLLTLFTLLFLSGIANSHAKQIDLTDINLGDNSLTFDQLNSDGIERKESSKEELISSDLVETEEQEPVILDEEIVEPEKPSLLLEESYLLPLPETFPYSWDYSTWEYSSWVSFDVFSGTDAINYSDYSFAAALHVGNWSWEWLNIYQAHLSFNNAEEIATYGYGHKATRIWLDSFNNFAGYNDIQLTVILLTNNHLYHETTAISIPSDSKEYSEAIVDYSWVDYESDSYVDALYCSYSTAHIMVGSDPYSSYSTRDYVLELIIRDYYTEEELYRTDFSSSDFYNESVIDGVTFGNFNFTVPISALSSQEISDRFEIIFIYSYLTVYPTSSWSGEDI
ncbi:MAG: hypothetical protein ACTSYA_02070, partial [Candidatus Kariarchaeaceae archaeon]